MIDLASLHDPDYHLREVTHDPSAYYLRKGEAPGRWRGLGATTLGLQGEVQPQALHDLFDGKHPVTGEYLISARGSSARANARDRERHVDVKAAAVTLGLSESRVRALLRDGRIAAGKTPRGAWRIPTDALADFRAGRNTPKAVPAERPAPGADGAYALVTAATIVGVDRSYLQRLIATERPEVTARAGGRSVQYLVGFQDAGGRWRVPAAELDRFIADRHSPRAVPAYDLAVRAPKSVSVLHALGHLATPEAAARLALPAGASVASEVLAAHHAALDDTIAFLERHAAFVRSPGGRVPATGLTVAVFDHRSSRAGDPLLHSHLVIANVARGVDGRTAALDATALYAWARPAGHVYQARLRHELTRRLGIRFHEPHNGMADIDGVPREVIDLFSERRRQILRRMAELGTAGAKAAQVATLDTRVAKGSCEHGLTPDELATRAAAAGFGAKQVASLLDVASPAIRRDAELAKTADHLAGPDGLCARDTTVDLRDAICGFATDLPAGATAHELERWASALLHDPHRFLPVLARPCGHDPEIHTAAGSTVKAGGAEPGFTTPELLDHEQQICALYAAGLGAGAGVGWGVATPEAVAGAVACRQSLRAEQRSLVSQVATSGLGVDVVVGRPGSGKTFALGVAADAWRASGNRVVGCSLQGGASEVLAVEASLDEQYTLTGLLLRCEQDPRFLTGAVVVLDEAGMADTRQLAQLATHAAACRAKLVLVGDPDQIPEVDAGGAFAHLVHLAGDRVVTLAENHRQVDPADRHRLELVRQGHGADAIASAIEAGRWHRGETADEVRLQLLHDWHTDLGVPAADKLLVATTVAEVEQLNTAARAMLTADRKLGRRSLTITCHAPNRAVDTRELRVGDRVRATRNRRGIGVFTGRVGTVTAVDPERFTVTVELDRMREPTGRLRPRQTVTLDRGFLCERELRTRSGHLEIQAPGLTHAYASTANAVQGRTAARAYVLVAEAGLYRQAAYVALSRARFETHLYGLTIPDPDEIDRQAQAGGEPDPDPDDTEALATALVRDAAQIMASVADPLAIEAGALLTRPPAWLSAERDRIAAQLGGRAPLREALRHVRTRLADAYRLPLEALECHQLTSAMTAALQVPGATPERLARLMLTRGQAVTRELDTAEDPMAVLVWAAGDHAVAELTKAAEFAAANDPRPPDERAAQARLEQRLTLLDSALARQHEQRLAAAAHPASPVAGLLGSRPGHPGGDVPWGRAAEAIVDYRDRVGMFDHDSHDEDAWRRGLGERPSDPALAEHYDQVRSIVVDCKTAILLAELPRFVPAQTGRPSLDVARDARRSLRELRIDITELRNRLSAEPAALDPAASARAEVDRLRLLRTAARVRETELATAVLVDPPAWLRAAVANEVVAGTHRGTDRWADTAMRGAVWADLTGTDVDNTTVAGVLGDLPTDPELADQWQRLAADLAPAPPPVATEPPIGLEL